MHPLIEQHKEAIRALCREFGVKRHELFGSAATDEFDPDRSDVDFLVEYPDDYDFGPWIGRLQDLERNLATEPGRDVDLVMTSALKNRWFKRTAELTRMVIYDASIACEAA